MIRADMLPAGRDSAITYGELAERLNIPRRGVERFIRHLRLSGLPVVTGNEGVWLASTSQEARSAAESLRSRAIHQMETAQALERAADAMDRTGQEVLPWAA